MPRELKAIESTTTTVKLDDSQATTLAGLGRELAARQGWWGKQTAADDKDRSVIGIRRSEIGYWDVTFREVVGVVELGDVHITVIPKIPQSHFNYLVGASEIAPRVANRAAQIAPGEDIVNLVAIWCVRASERLLGFGLRLDYVERSDELSEVRGRIDIVPTVLATACGRAVAACEFDELDEDTPLNRLVKASCRAIAGSAKFRRDLRRRALNVAARMDSVGFLRQSDFHATADRLTRSYSEILPLAKLVLAGAGIKWQCGACVGSAFLLRTPEIIEDGFRGLLAKILPDLSIVKRKLTLGDSGLSIAPDLVFLDGYAVGDIKYRFLKSDWDRSSFNQAVTFATGFRSKKCAVLGFASERKELLPRPVSIGPVEVQAFAWDARSEVSPMESAARISSALRTWITSNDRCHTSQQSAEASQFTK